MNLGFANGYSRFNMLGLFRKVTRSLLLKRITTLTNPSDSSTYFLKLSFLPGISYRLRNSLKHPSFKISFSAPNTLRSLLPSHTDRFPDLNNSGVYRLTCACGHKYIGRTFRSFDIRLKEHSKMINPIKLMDLNYLKQRSSFAHHVLTCSHPDSRINYNVEILHISSDNKLTAMLESLEILCSMHNDPLMTLNDTVDFSNLQLIKTLINKKFIH